MKEIKNKLKNKMQFIRTSDEDTAKILRDSGYTELTEQSSICYCFLNNGILTFDEETNEKINKNICYTNILCI